MKHIRRGISFLLAVVMVLGMIPPVEVRATETEPTVETAAQEHILPTEETTEPTVETSESTVETSEPTVETSEPRQEVTVPGEEEPVLTETVPAEEVTEVSAPAYDAAAAAASGTCGDDLSWSFDETTGTLTISGTGPMKKMTSTGSPWYNYREKITAVALAEGVTTISELAFYGCKFSDFHIPGSVTEIGPRAFESCNKLTSITIPGNVSVIGQAAFASCHLLANVTVLDGVQKIEERAFSACSSLTSIDIPDSVLSLGESAFFMCSQLTGVSLSGNLTALSDGLFYMCEKLPYVKIPDGVTSIGSDAFHRCFVLSNVIIPDGVTNIGSNAFNGCRAFTKISIPDSVTTIGSGAFETCTALAEVTLSDRLSEVADKLFNGCTSLTSIRIPDSVTSIGNFAFNGCTSLAYITQSSNIVSIGDYAFNECTKLPEIEIPDGVVSIGSQAFYNCYKPTSLELPDSVVSIGSAAFSKCSGLTHVVLPKDLTVISGRLFNGCTQIPTIEIPDSVTEIGEGAFSACFALNPITIPEGVVSIGPDAFSSCRSLISISVPDGITEMDGTFAGCSSLTSIKLPDGVKILDDTFAQCKALPVVELPDTVVEIGSGTFNGCSSLERVNIPNGVTVIGSSAFQGCTELDTVSIPDSVTSIGSYAFYGSGLTSVRIPGRVTSIGKRAFFNCHLTTVTMGKSVKRIEADAFRYNAYAFEVTDVYYEGTEDEWNQIYGHYELNGATIHYNTPMTLDDYYGFDITDIDDQFEITSGDDLLLTFELTRNGESVADWSKPTVTTSGYTEIVDIGEWEKSGSCWILTIRGREPGIERLQISQSESGRTMYITVHVKPAPIAEYIDNRFIEINGSGKAYAYYKSSPGVTYSLNVNGQRSSRDSDNKGVIRVPLGSFSEEGTYALKVTFTSVGGQALEEPVAFNACVNVKPLEYTQNWDVSLDTKIGVMVGAGGNLDILDFKGEAVLGGITYGGSFGNVLNASMAYSGGKRELELINDCSGSPEVGIKSGLSGEMLNMDIDIASVSADVSATTTGRYGIRFDNYDEDDVPQQLAIAAFIVESAGRVLSFDLILNAALEELEMKEIYADCGAVTIEGEGAAFSKGADAGIGEISITKKTGSVPPLKGFSEVSAGKKTVASLFRQTDSTGAAKYATNYTFSENLSAGNLEIGSGNTTVSGDTVAMEYLGRDTTVELQKSSAGVRTLETTALCGSEPAIGNFIEGTSHKLNYNKVKFEGDSLDVLMNNIPNYASYVSGRRTSITDEDLVDLGKYLSSDQARVAFEKMIKEKTLHSKKVGISGALGVGLDIGFGLSYMESNEYSTKSGYVYNDSFLVTGESDDYSHVIESNTTDMGEIVDTAFGVLWEELKNYFALARDNMKKGVSNLWAGIKGKPDSTQDWSLTMCSPSREGDWTEVSSIRVTGSTRTASSVGNAVTVGRPVMVGVTDDSGAEVTDLSADPLEFTITYTAGELSAAGISGSDIAMYRYNEEGDFFEYVGGVHAQDALAVTATIDRPGQYTLAVYTGETGSGDQTEPAVRNRVTIAAAELNGQTSVWVDGTEYALQRNGSSCYVDLPDGNARTMVSHTWHEGDPSDVHTRYPLSMKVWILSSEDGIYTAVRAEELDNILQYSGSSIRVTGKKGIRMITSMEQSKKAALTADGLAGFTLKEYGTVVAWAKQMGDKPLVLDRYYTMSNYAYRKGVADPVFANDGSLMQYTNVLVGFSNARCGNDLVMRPYMILEDAGGNEMTLYGGIVQRSIGYIAYQNRDVFTAGTDAYAYVWDIIHSVYGDAYDADYEYPAA